MGLREAVVCVGDAGINGLATVRSLGRRGVPVHVVALQASPQVASRSRYCRGYHPLACADDLCARLLAIGKGKPEKPVLYVDNDPTLRLLAPHAAALAARFALVDPIAEAERLTDKAYQLGVARQCAIAVPRSWFPGSWPELQAIGRQSAKRLIAKPSSRSARFAAKALIAPSAAVLEAELRGRGASPADVLVQEYIEGDDAQIRAGLGYRARSVDRCFVLSAAKLRQSQPGAGVMAVGQACDVPEVREMTRRLAAAAGVHGVLCTEFKRDPSDGKYYFIEWNPRPAYFQSLGWKAGFDLAWLAWCDHADPLRLPAACAPTPSRHYWINLHADLMHLAKAPRRALDPRTWRPYLGPAEWAVFAADDPRPWLHSLRHLAAWLRAKFSRQAAAARAARRAAGAAADRSRAPQRPVPW